MTPSICPNLNQAKWPLATADGRSFRGQQKINLLTAQSERALAPTATSDQQSLFESFVDLALTDSNQQVQGYAINLLIREVARLSFAPFPPHRLELILRSKEPIIRFRLLNSDFYPLLTTGHWIDLACDARSFISAAFWSIVHEDRTLCPLNNAQLLMCAKHAIKTKDQHNIQSGSLFSRMIRALEHYNLITPAFLNPISSEPGASIFYTHWLRNTSRALPFQHFFKVLQKFVDRETDRHCDALGFGFMDCALNRVFDAPSEAALTVFEAFVSSRSKPTALFSLEALQSFRIRCEAMNLHERAGFTSPSGLPSRSRIAL